jgi:hypothetical protein
MALEMLIQEAQGMSEEALMEVVHFMQFLKITTVKSSSPEKLSDHVRKVKRSAGMYRDKGWMADDFDAPLDDFKEYM